MTDDIPLPPSRLFEDTRVLKPDGTPPWEGRRSNKMRERYPAAETEVVRGLNLVAPVQPSTMGRNFYAGRL